MIGRRAHEPPTWPISVPAEIQSVSYPLTQEVLACLPFSRSRCPPSRWPSPGMRARTPSWTAQRFQHPPCPLSLQTMSLSKVAWALSKFPAVPALFCTQKGRRRLPACILAAAPTDLQKQPALTQRFCPLGTEILAPTPRWPKQPQGVMYRTKSSSSPKSSEEAAAEGEASWSLRASHWPALRSSQLYPSMLRCDPVAKDSPFPLISTRGWACKVPGTSRVLGDASLFYYCDCVIFFPVPPVQKIKRSRTECFKTCCMIHS